MLTLIDAEPVVTAVVVIFTCGTELTFVLELEVDGDCACSPVISANSDARYAIRDLVCPNMFFSCSFSEIKNSWPQQSGLPVEPAVLPGGLYATYENSGWRGALICSVSTIGAKCKGDHRGQRTKCV
jgi:hypothetical protein